MNVPYSVIRRWALAVTLLSMVVAHSPANAVTIDWVTVGDAGNTADTTGYGAVAYQYQIMKYEWTNAQYTAFLNAIDPDGSNPNAVYNLSMGTDVRGGIGFDSLASTGSKYSVKASMDDKPVNDVSWWDAARVSNWLHNGSQTYGSTDASATAPQNTGAYEVGTNTSGSSIAKNPGALYWLPTENEWYKAAYYAGGSATYRTFANGFDTNPATVTADSNGNGSAGGSGNFANHNFSADWNGQDGNVTTVGTNGGASPYGLYDMNGNVWEWNDLDGTAGILRGIRGGSLGSTTNFLSSDHRDLDVTTIENDNGGFRLVPEPSTWALGIASVGLALHRRRKQG